MANKKLKSKRKRIIPILITQLLLIIFGSLLVLGLYYGEYSLEGLIGIKSESVYFILTLMLLFVLTLFIILILLLAQTVKFSRMNHNNETIVEEGKIESNYENMKIKAMGSSIYSGSKLNVDDLNIDEEAYKSFLLNEPDDYTYTFADGVKADVSEEDEKNYDTRFYMLTKLDEYYAEKLEFDFTNDITLKDLCDDFREYASSRLGLFYSIDDIRRFISSLATSHILILQGMSGTGKTSLAYAFGEYIKNPSTIVPIQPMWKERTDLLGYYNEFTKKFNETTLLEKIYEANYNDNIYITVLDEMNIARVEYYFAEFLSLLEIPNLDSRYLDVVSDKWETDPKLLKEGKVKLPINMWFIGTANNDDSTFAISDKVYDRAMVINLDNKSNAFDGKYEEEKRISATRFLGLVEMAKKEYRITRRCLDRIKRLDSYLIDRFHITFGNRIMKQIKEYVPVYISCGGKENEAIDDILSRKVIRKLEALNPVYVRKESENFIKKLDEIFGENQLKQCKDYISQLARVS